MQHFVNMDELEVDIEKALNSRTTHSFAIDTEGNRYVELPDGSTEIQTGKTMGYSKTVQNKDTKAET